MHAAPWERRLLLAAAVVGLVHAAFSLSWALGSKWLLPTVGKWAVSYAREAPLAAVLLTAVAAVKAAVAVLPLMARKSPSPFSRLVRVAAWLAAAVLTVYGAVNSVSAWLVLGGVLAPDGGFDPEAMAGHAYLWDPLFLGWGVLLGCGLVAGRARAGVSTGSATRSQGPR